MVVAFRGTWSAADWASNLRSIIPGDEERCESFLASLDVARAAQRKYVLFSSIRLTGHSRGGNMADLFGRKLGLPSIGINPATWGKAFKEQEPAVSSITARTADFISVLETFPSASRQVVYRWPRGASVPLAACIALAAARAVLLSAARRGSLPAVLVAGPAQFALSAIAMLAVLLYLAWMHSVLRFTKR